MVLLWEVGGTLLFQSWRWDGLTSGLQTQINGQGGSGSLD
jgi:hypothetical protein